LRGGIGLATKAPSLNQVYTGPRYLDLLLGDYRLPGVYSVAIVQTIVIPANNVDLKPSKSWRSELGLDWKLPFANLALTGYDNILFDGFTTKMNIIELDKSKVEIHTNGIEAPTFIITGSEKLRHVVSTQSNAYESRDKGLEMILAFKKIESLNLSIGVKGTYVETKSNRTNETFSKATIENETIAYGIFKPYETISKVSRAGLSLDYHIPKAGLIISVNSDHFLVDSRLWKGDKNPVAYLDNNLVRHTVTVADLENPVIKSFSSNTGYVDSEGRTDFDLNGKTFHNFHLRISKDFLSGVRISVYLNNMFNLKVYNSYGYRYSSFTPISFGGNMSYQF